MRTRFGGSSVLGAVLVALLLGSPPADACRRLRFELMPTEDLQMVIWLEDGSGRFLDTIYMTDKTGRYGIGNRPGRFDFNSEWQWPYGRRITTFPVWAGRSPVEYPKLVFQDDDDSNLSHAIDDSSPESYFCRPLKSSEVGPDLDAMTCASVTYTDKGKFHPTETSKYPPRNDMTVFRDGIDHDNMKNYESMNQLDAVSHPTPPGGVPLVLSALMSSDLPPGPYVVWIEVGKEFDQNEAYDYPEPVGIPWSEYGRPYRGQPSVLWQLPFTVDDVGGVFLARGYFGHGDPDGLTGTIHPTSDMITTGVPGSGADRLLEVGTGVDAYRFKVEVTPANDTTPPAAVGDVAAPAVGPRQASLSFEAPADDGGEAAAEYQIRISAGVELTAETFLSVGQPISEVPVPSAPGATQTLVLGDLLPETSYWVGIRALDGCLNEGPLVLFEFQTSAEEPPPVSGCACDVGARRGRTGLGLGGLGIGGLGLALTLGLRLRRRRARSAR